MALSQILQALNLPDPVSGIRDIQSKFTVSNAFKMAMGRVKRERKSPRNNITERKTTTQVENRINQGGDIILAESQNFTIKAPIKDSIINIYNPRRVIMGEGGSADPTTRAERREEELEARRKSNVGGFAGLMGASAITKNTRTGGGDDGDDGDDDGDDKGALSKLLGLGGTALDILGALAAGKITLSPVLRRVPLIGRFFSTKAAKDIARTADTASDVARTADTASDVARTADTASDVARTADTTSALRSVRPTSMPSKFGKFLNFARKAKLAAAITPVGAVATVAETLLSGYALDQIRGLQEDYESIGNTVRYNRPIEVIKILRDYGGKPIGEYHQSMVEGLSNLRGKLFAPVRQAERTFEREKSAGASGRDLAGSRGALNAAKKQYEIDADKVVEAMAPYLKFTRPGRPAVFDGDLDALIQMHKSKVGNKDIIPVSTREREKSLLEIGTLPDVDISQIETRTFTEQFRDSVKVSPEVSIVPEPARTTTMSETGMMGVGTPIIVNNNVNNQIVDQPLSTRPTVNTREITADYNRRKTPQS